MSAELEAETVAPLLAKLLSVDSSSSTDPVRWTGDELQFRTLTALVDVFCALSRTTPSCIFVEDLHWIDSTTQLFLERLVEAIRRERVLPLFEFKHALVRDAAYESLLGSRRAELHLAVADALLDGERMGVTPGMLAEHFALGEMPEKSVGFFVQAGRPWPVAPAARLSITRIAA